MGAKAEILLVKRSLIEVVLETSQQRKAALESKPMAKTGDMFDKVMAEWEALTAMRVVDGTAIIPLRGVITPDDPFASLYGETSLASFTQNFNAAVADDKVKGIVIHAYTPGGYVYGVEAAANAIYAARGKKPIIGYTDSLAASAGYWLLSATDQIVLGAETAEVGSIGVYLAHFDYSTMLEKVGIKVTEITAGEFKGIGSPYAALDAADKKLLQQDVDYVYSRFVNTVARNRGLSIDDTLKSANGLTFYGSAAIKAGLADSINTLQEVIAMTTNEQKPNTAASGPSAEELAAAKARAETAEAELKVYREKAAKAELDRATAECKDQIKLAFGRDATEEEVAAYVSMNEDSRKVFKATLAEAKANQEKVIKAAGLMTEQVTQGANTENSLEGNGLVQAAARLGLSVVK